MAPEIQDAVLGAVMRRASLLRYAEELEARIASGDTDPDVIDDARAARAAALALESYR